MKVLFSIAVFFIVIALFSCRSTKTIQTAMSKKDSALIITPDSSRNDSLKFMHNVYQAVEKNRIDFETFSAKVKVDFEGSDGKKNDFNAFIRLRKDSAIWVSINALLGFEAFRVLITPDSVKVINKLDKVVQLRSVSYLKEITKLPFSFQELQDLLVGNPIYFSDNIVSYKKDAGGLSVLHMGPLFKHLLTLNPDNMIVQHSKLDDVDPVRARTADISYGDYETRDGKPFSTFRKITVSEKSKLDIEMKFKQFDFNIPLNFPFSIAKNYKLQ
ncbi:MAG: DUF4292 domain-containing protein [Chitinophagaceae bacterium]|nr:DUF4292 domain-containing protein [Chitinophagaceae bacterium]